MSPALEPPKLPKSFVRQIQKITSWVMGISFGSVMAVAMITIILLAIFVRTETFKNGLRDRIIQVAQQELEATIEYDEAVVSLFRLEPNIEFRQIRFSHQPTNLDLQINRVAVSISLFLTLPLLLFKELYISRATINGLDYELTDYTTFDRWAKQLKPAESLMPSAFQTTIRIFEFKNINLNVDIRDKSLPGDKLKGQFRFEQLELGLYSSRMTYGGRFQVKDFSIGSQPPQDFDIEIEDGVHRDETTHFRDLKIKHLSNEFSLSGSVKNFKDPYLDLTGRLTANLSDYFSDIKLMGRSQAIFSVKGLWNKLEGRGDANLTEFRFRKKKLDYASGRWKLNYPQLVLEDFQWRDGEAKGALDGQIKLGSVATADLRVSLEGARLGTFLGLIDQDKTNWGGGVSGELSFKGDVFPQFAPEFNWALLVNEFIIRNADDVLILRVPTLEVSGNAKLKELEKGEFSASVKTAASHWGGGGSWDQTGMSLAWDSVFNGSEFGQLYFFDIKLLGSMKGVLQGPWDRLVMDVEQNLDFFQFDDQKLTNFKGHLILADRILAGRPLTSDQLDVQGGIYFYPNSKQVNFSNLQFKATDLSLGSVLNFFETTRNHPLSPKAKFSAKGEFTGHVLNPEGRGTLLLDDFRFKTDRTMGRVLRSNWQFVNQAINLNEIQIFMSPDSDPVNGFIKFDRGDLSEIKLTGNRLRLNDWALVLETDLPMRAFAKLDLQYEREIKALRAKARIYETQFAGMSQPDSFIDLEMIEDELNIETSFFDDQIKAQMEAKQTRQMRSTQISFDIQNLDIVPLIPAIRDSRYQVEIEGKGQAKMTQQVDGSSLFFGFFSEPPKFQGKIDVNKALIRRSTTILQQIRPFQVKISPGRTSPARWEVDKILIRSPNKKLEVSGYYESIQSVNLVFKGNTDLRSISGFVPGLSRSEGIFTVDGTLNQNGYSGLVELEEGLLTFQKAPLVMRKVNARLQSQNSDMRLLSMEGEFRDGQFSANGRIRWALKGIPSAQLALSLENTLIELDREVRFRAAGPLHLSIENFQGNLSGRLTIRDAVFNRRFSLSGDFAKAFQFGRERSRFYQAEERKDIWDDWKLNVGFVTEDPVILRNNVADAAANLNLTVRGTVKDPLLRGSIDLVRGRFTYNNQDFNIQSGAVVFNNPKSNVPSYDLRSEAQIEDFRVFMNIRGNQETQEVTYSSDPPLPEKDVLSLVSFGSLPTGSQDPTRSTTFSGISFLTGRIQDSIENRLSLNLGIRRFSLFPAFDEETGETELAINVGTDLIKDKLRVNYSNFISAPGGNRVELDYRIVQSFSIVGSWREVNTKDQDDFGADLRFRFEFE